jgi:hypothetical protein
MAADRDALEPGSFVLSENSIHVLRIEVAVLADAGDGHSSNPPEGLQAIISYATYVGLATYS